MAHLTGLTRGGDPWTPAFIESLNGGRCIGCGRCFKVCSRDVFTLTEREEEESEDGFDDEARMVMVIHDAGDCIGCEACSRVCPKKCHKHAAWEKAA